MRIARRKRSRYVSDRYWHWKKPVTFGVDVRRLGFFVS